VERLVLLGDIVELRQGPWRAAFARAAPVLGALGEAMAGGEIVLVPGNHDHHLLSAWRERSVAPLALDSEVGWRDGDALGDLAGLMGPATISAHYPGLWLRRDVLALHGHYLDRHTTVPLAERVGAGVMARLAHEQRGAAGSPEEYERVLAPLYAWIHAVAQVAREDGSAAVGGRGMSAAARRALIEPAGGLRLRQRLLRAGFHGALWALRGAGVGELEADLSGPALRRAALKAMEQVVERLGVDAGWVIFGHTHRAGPLAGDEEEEWRTPAGTRLMNTGSWIHEPVFGGDQPQSPYRPGFAVMLEEQGPPRLVNLLDPARAPV
jgi:hypothetical protein